MLSAPELRPSSSSSSSTRSDNSDAATIASKANVKQLLLGHFSARYGTTDGFIKEAQPIFTNTLVAQEGTTYKVI